MKDGNFIVLSVSDDTAKVLVAVPSGPMDELTELVTFPVGSSKRGRRQEQAGILDSLRKQIGLPESVSELRRTAQGLKPPEHLAKGC